MKIIYRSFFKILFVSALLFAIISQPINSQLVLDTVQHKQVGPGMYYTKIIVNSVPWSIDVFEADMTNEYFSIETVKAFELLAGGREKTSAMSIRKNSSAHWAIAAVNGDFFNLTTGMPTNIQVENGEVLRNERADWPAIGFNLNNDVSISNAYLTGTLVLSDTSLVLNGLNVSAGNNQLIFYNRFYGESTGTTVAGFEAIINTIDAWLANDTVYCVVDSISTAGKNSTIPSGSIVISSRGAVASYLSSKLFVNDTIKIILNVQPSVNKLKEMMGGYPIIVKDGNSVLLNPDDSFVYTRHPRTAVGINQDTTKLFFVTVDGRQASSLGVNLFELADLMLQLGVYQGINLDGGGSTTMVIRNEVVNSPSDVSGERSVSNALLVISKAPLDTLGYLDISPRYSEIFIGRQVQFSVRGTDKFYNPIFINPSLIKYQLTDSSKGNISASGLFKAGNTSGDCHVLISYGNVKDSAKIKINGVGRVELLPTEVVTDKTRLIAFVANVYDSENVEQTILPQNISWVCSDTNVGSIDIVGQFQGKQNGIAKIIASYFGKSDTSTVKVEIGNGVIVLDSVETLSDWNLIGENVDTNLTKINLVSSPTSLGSYSIKLDYSFTYQTSQFNWAYLNTDNLIYGVPDSIMIDVRSDGALHRFFFDVVDNENKLFRISSHKFANIPNIFETIRGRIVSSATVYFPLTLKSISIVLGSTQTAGQNYGGTIYIDNLSVKYPQSTTLTEDGSIDPSSFNLHQNYPNPFNPTTKIRYSIPSNVKRETSKVVLKIFDMLGREVAILLNEEKPEGSYEVEFDGSHLSSGVYFYQLKTGNIISTKKMILLH